MITVSLDKSSLNAFKKDLDKLVKAVDDKGLNKHRAKSFKDYAYKAVSEGKVRLVPLSSATIALMGIHDPEFLTGQLMKEMKVESKSTADNSAIVGYWEPSKKVPGKKLTYAQLAVIQTTGYRIPLTGEKGRKVRAWLALNGLGLFGKQTGTKTKLQGIAGGNKWLVVPPRPFFHRALTGYIEEGLDIKAAEKYFKKVMK